MDKAIERGRAALDAMSSAQEPGSPSILADLAVPVSELPTGFLMMKDGVYYMKDSDTPPMRVCSPLHVLALVRDGASQNWGRLLELTDADGVTHRRLVPMEMLCGDGTDMRRELAQLGLEMAPTTAARNKLSEYITGCRPLGRARCVQHTGWSGSVFVMPDRTVGTSDEEILYQAESIGGNYAQSGDLDEWREHVSRLCEGNSRLMCAVAAALAGMLLHHVDQDSGGLHFVGGSSTGKTTALQVAASVYGGPSFVNNWRATSNGLEGLCAIHNDGALILDELAQVNPRDAGEIVYMIGNGGGKTRSTRSGEARRRKAWRIIIISAGEIGLAQHMLDGGKIVKAGQEVRMIDLVADAGAGHGVFETLHGYEGGSQLSDAIKAASRSYYGVAAIAFLEHLTAELDSAPVRFRAKMDGFVERHLPGGAGGQAARVCRRFAAIACAGEYATAKGITGWQSGAAEVAAVCCFQSWLDAREGGGNQERRVILSSVKAFFETHGDARFTDITVDNERITVNRAGFRRASEAGQEYYVLPEAYRREVCHGHEPSMVTKVLIAAGWLVPDRDGKSSQKRTLPGMGETRCYVFAASMWRA